MSAEVTRQIQREELSKHNKPTDGWMSINGLVYDVSKFYEMHPGGSNVLAPYLGKDATDDFFGLHRSSVLDKYKRLVIGQVQGEKPTYVLPEKGELSVVPFAEPPWLTKAYSSPYFNDGHRALQREVRKFFDTYVSGRSNSLLDITTVGNVPAQRKRKPMN